MKDLKSKRVFATNSHNLNGGALYKLDYLGKIKRLQGIYLQPL